MPAKKQTPSSSKKTTKAKPALKDLKTKKNPKGGAPDQGGGPRVKILNG
jgi:hypothetical protein